MPKYKVIYSLYNSETGIKETIAYDLAKTMQEARSQAEKAVHENSPFENLPCINSPLSISVLLDGNLYFRADIEEVKTIRHVSRF